MDIIRSEEYKSHRIEVYADDDPVDPRENDNLGVMACFHKWYKLGDEHDHVSSEFGGWEAFERHLREAHDAVIILPLFFYDHSGLHLKVGNFKGLLPQGHAEFDSGQVGFIYATKEAILKNYMVKRATKAVLCKAAALLHSEVEEYDHYLSGNVVAYAVLAPPATKCDKCGHQPAAEQVDSCGGYYSTEEAIAEARGAVDARTNTTKCPKCKENTIINGGCVNPTCENSPDNGR